MDKRPPLGGYKDQTTSLHLSSRLLAKVRAAATASPFNQSDIFRVAVERYIDNDLVPEFTESQKERFDMSLKMELQALDVEEQPKPQVREKKEDDDFLTNL